MTRLAEIGGRRLPIFRWSFVRMMLGMRKLATEWQVGDGREEALARHVLEHARAGDLADAIRAVDEFCYRDALLEFVTEIDGITVNGVDLIRWDDAGRIVDFKVMVRPLKAINVLHAKMGELLAKLSAKS